MRETELGSLRETQVSLLNAPELPGQTHLPESNPTCGNGLLGERGSQSQRHRQIAGGLPEVDPAGNIDKDVAS